MNALCYKIVFSKRFGCLIAVGEHAKGQGKKAGTAIRTSHVATQTGNPSSQYYLGLLQSICLSIALGLLTVDTNLASTTAPDTNALPTGYSVNAGQVGISTSAGSMTIKQTSDKASINWQSFNIGKDATVTGATFGSKNVATDANGNVVSQAVTLQGLAITGTDAKNYTVSDASSATATISKKAITGAAASDKVYDQTNTATLTNSGALTSGAATSPMKWC